MKHEKSVADPYRDCSGDSQSLGNLFVLLKKRF